MMKCHPGAPRPISPAYEDALKILIYGLNYSPELTGIGKYTGEMAAWLSTRGHQVHVVAAPPYYPAWRIWDDYRGRWYWTQREPDKPVVYRTPLYVPSRPTGVKRMLHLFSFMLGSLPVMAGQIFWRPDAVFTVEPTFFGAPVALAVAGLCGAKSWLHVQDFEIDAAFELGLLPARGPVHKLALWLEGVFTRAFTRVSSISGMMVNRTEQKGVPPGRAVMFPNWVDVDAVFPLQGENEFRRVLELGDKMIVLYSGNMGNKQGLELLAPLARAFAPGGTYADERVHFLFCGDGAFRPKLEGLVGGLENVTLLGLQPMSELNELLNAADIHLLPQRAGAADLVMPSKLTGMLSSGRPVLATADAGTQVAKVVGHPLRPCGVVVPAEDPEALHAALARMIADAHLRHELGAAGRAYAVRCLGREEVLLKFEQDLIGLTRQRK